MNQVFVSNHAACIQANADTTLFSGLSHTTGASDGHDSCMVGVYNPSNNRFLDGTTAALSLIAPDNVTKITAAAGTWASDGIDDDTGIAAGQEAINIAPTSPQFLNYDFQIVQAQASGNPVASPIIQTSQLKSLTWEPNVAPVKHKIALAADAALGTPTVGDEFTVILNLRFPQGIAFYESQINASTDIANISQLAAAFDNPKRIYKTSFVCATATAASVVDGLIAAINAHAMGDFVTATDNGSTGLFIEADFYGIVIDATITQDDGSKLVGSTNSAAMKIGVGSFAEVVSEEKAALYSQGIMNRMYLPTGDQISASKTAGGATSTETANYDRLCIEYVNRASQMPGFNAGGNTSTITLYTPANATFAAQATGLALEDTFGLSVDGSDAAATSVRFIW